MKENESDEFEYMPPEKSGGDYGLSIKAEIDVQIATAKRYPRDLERVKKDMLTFACLDEETAASCFYSVPRGGKTIQGPSIRMAEIAVSSFMNLRAGTKILSTVTEGDNPHVVVIGACHDLEKNTAFTMEKRRRIFRKKDRDGNPLPVDEDAVNLAVNSCSAIALRDAAFKVIPRALINPIVEKAKKVAVGSQETLVNRRAKMVDYFAKMGITKDRVFAAVGQTGIEGITLTELETLIGFSTAIKEGHSKIDDVFPTPPPPGARVVAGFEGQSKAADAPKQEAATAGTKESKKASKPTEEKTKSQPELSVMPDPVKKPGNDLEELLAKIDAHKITSAAVLIVGRGTGAISDDSLATLKEVFEIEPGAIATLNKNFGDMIEQFRQAQ